MAGGTHIPVEVFESEGVSVVRPSGACTIAICETLTEYVRQVDQRGVRELYLDLSGADWLDSTFTGLLLALAAGKRRPQARMYLYRPSEAARKTLENMHVASLLPVVDALPPHGPTGRLLEPVELSRDRAGDLVIDAHEELIAADSRNAPRFGPVVDVFRKSRDAGK
jgi:anti-anti-sigma factor